MRFKFTTIAIFLLTTSIVATAFGQEQPLQDPLIEVEECSDTYTVQAAVIVDTFYQEAEAALKTANLNSESLNYIFKQYRTAQQALSRLERISTNPGITSDLEAPNIATTCPEIFRNIKVQFRYAFLQFYTQTASQKKDILLFEKYDSINQQFENTQENIRSINSNINQFDDLLPCFVTSWIRN